jgi:hypothetical protein
MILTKEQTAAILEAAKPLMKWISDNCHPHCAATVEAGSVELTEGIAREITDEFIDRHDSDCATHNMPAYPIRPCDCRLKPNARLDRTEGAA